MKTEVALVKNAVGRSRHIKIAGMEIHLGEYFFADNSVRRQSVHVHPCHELSFVNATDTPFFVITPPKCEHPVSEEHAVPSSSFLYSALAGGDPISAAMCSVKKTTVIQDTFDGKQKIDRIKALAEDASFGAKEHIEAELRLLVVEIARRIGEAEDAVLPPDYQSLDGVRLAKLDSFFNLNISDSNCSKTVLADEIGVSERQLSRILHELYGKNFYALLLEARMNVVQDMLEHGCSVDDMMRASGYISRRTFERAYKNYFGISVNRAMKNRTQG